ncbi:MAG TPA: hypothetical protein VMZ25_05135 [Terriglobales bacterium]|nr:hypothetical protein [Terriglobales bacterium]
MKPLYRIARLVACLALGSLASAQQFDPSLYKEMRWRMIGPFRGGRTIANAGVPNKPNLFYIGVVNGGVWKTTDYGRVWRPIFDGQATGSVGAIAVAPSDDNVIYVGSGEGRRRPDLATGDGVFKSTDAGKTWQHMGLPDAQQINSIIVDPRDANHVYVAVIGHPYGPNEQRGVYESKDGGKNWERVLYKDADTGAMQLVFAPNDPNTIYADMWSSRRPPWTVGNPFEGKTSGLYKSADGGKTWRQLSKGLPGEAETLGRIGLGIAPSDGNRIYALVDAAKNGGLYRSDNAGESWQRSNTQGRLWGRGSDFAGVVVHPKDKDTVFVANTSTYKSTDAGKTFTAIKGAPGGDDYQTIWINPNNPDIMLFCADQGATITVNGGQTWSSWYNQPTAQFYHVITDNRFPYWVYGGQQESGSAGVASRGDFGAITERDWHPVGTEEYGYVAPDPLNPNFIYGGKGSRFDRRTGQTQNVSPFVLRSGKYRFNRTAPLIFAHADSKTLYLGSNVLFKTSDGGNSWQIISPDLTREDPGWPATLGKFIENDPAKGKHRGVIYSIGPSFKDPNTIWVGTDDGLVHITRDGGKRWKDITPPELTPWSKIAQIEASRFDEMTAYVAVNRFRLDDLHAYVYRTHDGGKSWKKVTRGLPDTAAVNAVREDPIRKGLLYAGTERTIYVSFNDGDEWQPLTLNLPASSMRDLVVKDDDIVVGTHGRSFWILDNVTPLRQMTPAVAGADAFLFKPQVTYRLERNVNTDTPLPPEEPMGQNPPDGAMLDYILKADSSTPVVIEISDAAGKLVRKFSSADVAEPVNPDELAVPMYWIRPARPLSAKAGMHRFVWDLHYPSPDVLDHDYPISAIPGDTPRHPLGAAVLPGQYTVKLTAGGKSYSQTMSIKMDPRAKTSPLDIQKQFALSMKITDAITQDFKALNEVRAFRKKLRAEPASEANAALDKKAAAIEEGTPGTNMIEDYGLARLNRGLAGVLDAVQSADTVPTTQAVAMFATLEKILATKLNDWNALQQQIKPK